MAESEKRAMKRSVYYCFYCDDNRFSPTQVKVMRCRCGRILEAYRQVELKKDGELQSGGPEKECDDSILNRRNAAFSRLTEMESSHTLRGSRDRRA